MRKWDLKVGSLYRVTTFSTSHSTLGGLTLTAFLFVALPAAMQAVSIWLQLSECTTTDAKTPATDDPAAGVNLCGNGWERSSHTYFQVGTPFPHYSYFPVETQFLQRSRRCAR